jgi:hypothetical protein
MSEFNEGWKVSHPVEKQWHYETMIKYGFKPLDMVKSGWIREYSYSRDNIIVKCITGASSDRWECGSEYGLWSRLESFLKENIRNTN